MSSADNNGTPSADGWCLDCGGVSTLKTCRYCKKKRCKDCHWCSKGPTFWDIVKRMVKK